MEVKSQGNAFLRQSGRTARDFVCAVVDLCGIATHTLRVEII
jgi:hypothetical protein